MPFTRIFPQQFQHPIGVFDSGVGGLTVLRALREELPDRDFLYVADTARLPYDRKPKEMVQGFARQIAGFLVAQGVEGLVIACNTASAASLPGLAEELPVPVWGVIDAGVEAARHTTRTGRVGVIGTKGTIGSGAYQRKLEACGFTVWAQACPLFVHVVEEGLAHSPEAELLAQYYLASRPELDTLVLGCTHYPLLRDVLQKVVGDQVRLVTSSEAIAAELGRRYHGTAGRPDPNHFGRVVHYVTGDAAAYRHSAQVAGGVEGEVIQLDVVALDAQSPATPLPLPADHQSASGAGRLDGTCPGFTVVSES